MATAKLELVLSESDVNIVNNTSKVTAKLYYYGNGVSYNYDNPEGTITIDGTEYAFNHDITTSTSKQLLATKSKIVTHNADGEKTAVVSAVFKTRTSAAGTLKKSASLELTKIPRASDITLDKTTVLADGNEAVIATVTKKIDTYTDELSVSLGDYSQPIEAGVAFTIPEEWINAIPGTTAIAKVTVTTSSEDVVIGTNTADLEVQVPDGIVPVINGVTVTEAVAKVAEAFGNLFVQNLSQLNVNVDAEGVYGSSIASYSVTLDGVTYIQKAFTTNVIKAHGALNGSVTVVDSRGRSATDIFEVDIVEYQQPVVLPISFYYCDDDGNRDSNGSHTKVLIPYKAYPVEGQNSKSIVLTYKSTVDETATERIITPDEWEGTVEAIIHGADYSMTYKYAASLTDEIATSASAEVTTGLVVISRKAGGKGVTFFGEAEEDGLIVKGKNPLLFKDSEALEATKRHLGIGEVEDSGWITAELDPAFTAYATGDDPKYRKIGNLVEVVGTVKPTAEITGSSTQQTIFTLPEGYRPSAEIVRVCQGSMTNVWTLRVATTGEVTFERYRSGNTYATAGNAVWLPFQATFFASEGAEGETILTATHDGAGNVTAYGITATHDGAGNVRIV